jgi:hypothetical protein
MAVETVTLPTRLREDKGRPGSLAEFESVLNNTGSRSIFELQASVVTSEELERHYSAGEGSRKEYSGDESGARPIRSTGRAKFDVDYTPRGSHRSLGRKPHLFGQVEVRRCISDGQLTVAPSRLDDQDAIVEM